MKRISQNGVSIDMEGVYIFSSFNNFCYTTEFLVLYSKSRPNIKVKQPYELFQYRGEEGGKLSRRFEFSNLIMRDFPLIFLKN